jgi:hypothetical protein
MPFHLIITVANVRQPTTWSHDGQWLAFIRVTDQEADTAPLWLVFNCTKN